MAAPQSQSPFSGGERLLEPGFLEQSRLAWRLMRDPRVSGIKMAIPALMLLYLVSPIDVIPDFLLGIGQVDDVGVFIALFIAAITFLPKLAPAEVVSEHIATIRGNPFGGPTAPGPDPRAGYDDSIVEGNFRVRD